MRSKQEQDLASQTSPWSTRVRSVPRSVQLPFQVHTSCVCAQWQPAEQARRAEKSASSFSDTHIGALGDIHGDFASARAIMRDHSDIRLWVCVGDLADEAGHYQDVDAPLFYVKGNNETFDVIASGAIAAHLHFIPNATRRELAGLTIAGLGGTFAPTWYETPATELPHPPKGSARATQLADKRRHFVREEVEACKAMRGVDVFLTHEAA